MRGKCTWLGIVMLLFSTTLVAGCGVSRQEYELLKHDLQSINTNLENDQIRIDQANAELAVKAEEVSSLSDKYENLKDRYQILEEQLQYSNNRYNQVSEDYSKLLSAYSSLETQHKAAVSELDQSLIPPYASVSGRQISYYWNDTGGNIKNWTLPVDVYRASVEMPKPTSTVSIKNGDNTYELSDYRDFVLTEAFSKVVPETYAECEDELDYAKEAFNLVGQLNVYNREIGGIPRWPLETLTEGGGDCEDLAILFTALLKAAPYPYEVSLVYMDKNNAKNPVEPNHVIVQVTTKNWSANAECTNPQGWNYWREIQGWIYEVN